MKQFFQNRMDDLDADDVVRYIKKQLEGGSNYRGGGGGGGGSSHYSQSPEEEMKQLAKVHCLIQEFFEIQGLDPKSFYSSGSGSMSSGYSQEEDNYRRGGGRGR